MIKNFSLFLAGLLLTLGVSAQELTLEEDFSGSYLGIQGNELLRQLLDLGSAGVPDNPYFINYTLVGKDGIGLNVGFALSADEFNQNNGFNTINTEIDNFSIRMGYEKRKSINHRFFYSLGIDLLGQSQKNVTRSTDTFGSGGTVETISKTSGLGIGPRFTLNYKITDGLIIGTEANYYFRSLNEKFETIIPNSPSSVSEESDIKLFKFAVPSVIWISIRL